MSAAIKNPVANRSLTRMKMIRLMMPCPKRTMAPQPTNRRRFPNHVGPGLGDKSSAREPTAIVGWALFGYQEFQILGGVHHRFLVSAVLGHTGASLLSLAAASTMLQCDGGPGWI